MYSYALFAARKALLDPMVAKVVAGTALLPAENTALVLEYGAGKLPASRVPAPVVARPPSPSGAAAFPACSGTCVVDRSDQMDVLEKEDEKDKSMFVEMRGVQARLTAVLQPMA